jgi:NADH:ubiquinone oxidoreductase subunit F (NADH-binding)
VPAIILNGAEWFASYGVGKSRGTKVFALAGDIVNSGIIEIPMGMTLRNIIYKMGGGMKDGKAFKAVQSGGPSGGCLTSEHLDVSVDYESLAQMGAIMGSGGLIAMDENTCLVDTARYFMEFVQDESCGHCVPCATARSACWSCSSRSHRGAARWGLGRAQGAGRDRRDTAMCDSVRRPRTRAHDAQILRGRVPRARQGQTLSPRTSASP